MSSGWEEADFVYGFNGLSESVHLTAIEKGWWDTPRSDGECIALMHSELSEALEGLRQDSNDDHLPEFKSVEVEMADCIIRIMDLARRHNWKVGEALIAKMRFNKTRPYKHGKKF